MRDHEQTATTAGAQEGATVSTAKLPYVLPALREYGPVSKLTMNGNGSFPNDGGTGTMNMGGGGMGMG